MVELDPQRLPAAFVRSQDEILLPISGALSGVSAGDSTERRYRPLRSLEHSSELILAIEQEMARRGAANEKPRIEPSPPRRLQPGPGAGTANSAFAGAGPRAKQPRRDGEQSA